MKSYRYTLCSGSGNRFLMFDAAESDFSGLNIAAFAAEESHRFGVDGVLLLTHDAQRRFGMRMFNTDGSEAEMCGNGIRCVARLAHERYPETAGTQFTVTSGGRAYRLSCEEPIFGALPTFGAEIPLGLHSDDFPPSLSDGGFVGQPIPQMQSDLSFTFLSPGNPHIVACADPRSPWLFGSSGRFDSGPLATLGQRANRLRDVFPRGINVSLFCRLGEGRIFAATYERGVGITSSCGTAMTSCATAAALLGLCGFDAPVEVWNRGGRVRCLPRRTPQGLVTRLTGDATFEAAGTLRLDGRSCIADDSAPLDAPGDRLRMASETRRELNETYGLTIADQ